MCSQTMHTIGKINIFSLLYIPDEDKEWWDKNNRNYYNNKNENIIIGICVLINKLYGTMNFVLN